MIIPLKVKIHVSLENASEMSLETTQRENNFDGYKQLRYTKRNEPSLAKIKRIKKFTFHPPSTADGWQTILPRFSPALSPVSNASVPCLLNPLGRVPHMREFSRKCMMIHREVLGLSWLQPTGYQAPSILTKMAAEKTKIHHECPWT